MNGWNLPESVVIDETAYQINADYRDVLDIIEKLNDAERAERVRMYVALALFYDDFEAMPPSAYQEAAAFLMRFIACGEENTDSRPHPKTIDWEQDKQMIVADINKVAHAEIRALPFLHWWTFIAYFNGIGDGQLSAVVSIREKKRKGKKLDDWERDFYRENKGKVEFAKRYTAEETAEIERLKNLLGE